MKVILFYTIYSFSNDILLSWLQGTNDKMILRALFSLFTLVEYSTFTYFIFKTIKNPLYKKIILFISLLFFGVSIVIFIHNNQTFDTIPATVEAILIIIFCLYFLFEQIRSPQQYFIYSSSQFWVILGFLIYMSGTLFLFTVANELSDEEFRKFWLINSVCNTFKNIFFAIAFLIKNQPSQSPFLEKSYTDLFEKPPFT